jgi:hypothetical protein
MEKKRRTEQLVRGLKTHRRGGGFILLDSGIYEKVRLRDEKWTAHAFHEALQTTPHDMAFCFDDANPSSRLNIALKSIVAMVERDSKKTKAPILPIVHLPQDSNGDYRIDLAPKLVLEIARELRPPLIGIPERELGPGVFDRARTMAAIRHELHDLFSYQPIHVLGTGNPTTIALLTAAGADTFDGLEWCRYVVDGDRHVLRYMEIVGLRPKDSPPITRFTHYLNHEVTLQEHAAQLGYRVGLYDWAIWIVMRVLGREQPAGSVT